MHNSWKLIIANKHIWDKLSYVKQERKLTNIPELKFLEMFSWSYCWTHDVFGTINLLNKDP